ncbi:hypothetical protein K474DRAFT_1556119, partial [Panus rudis PR-1116 ss-1]
VCEKTVRRHANGGTSMSTFNAQKQKVSPAAERILVEYVKECADRGFALTHQQLHQEATIVYQSYAGPSGTLGKNWVDRFLIRYHDEL